MRMPDVRLALSAWAVVAFVPVLASDPSLIFEEHPGSEGAPPSFLARAADYEAWIEGGSVELSRLGEDGRIARVALAIADAGTAPRGAAPLPGKVHYRLGADPSAWKLDLATFGSVVVPASPGGVALAWLGSDRRLAVELALPPDSPRRSIRLEARGDATWRLDPNGGAAILAFGDGELRLEYPVAYGTYVVPSPGVLEIEARPDGTALRIEIATTPSGHPELLPDAARVTVDPAGIALVTGPCRSLAPERGNLFAMELEADGLTRRSTTYRTADPEAIAAVPAERNDPGDTLVTATAPGERGTSVAVGVTRASLPPSSVPVEVSPSGAQIFAAIGPGVGASPDAAGCPGTIRFTNGGGTGLWQTAANWDLNRLPNAADDACIPAGFTVTLSLGPQSVSTLFVASTSSLVVNASLSIAASSQVDGTLTLQPTGTLTGTGDVTLAGTLTWTGGQMTGAATVFANGGMNISGVGVKDLTASRTLVVAGNSTWSGTGALRLGSGGSITQNGLWDCQSDASISALAGAGAFTNSTGATFRKSAGVGTSNVAVPFHNAGTVEIQSGAVNLSGGGSHAGAFVGSTGTTLQFSGGTHTLGAASSVAAPTLIVTIGTVQVDGTYDVSTATTVDGGSLTLNAAATLASIGSTLAITGGTATLSSGEGVQVASLNFTSGTLQGGDTVTVSGVFTWSGGTMTGAATLFANGGLSVSGAPVKDVTGSRSLVVSGSTTWSGTGSIRLGTGGSITHHGTWQSQSDAAIGALVSPGTFTNALGATFRKSAGAGTSSIAVPFNNTGSIEIQSGTLTLNGGGSHSGSFLGSAGTTLQFGGGTHTLGAGSSVAPSTLVVSTGTVNLDGSYNATAGTTVEGGTLNLNPSATLLSIGAALSVTGGTANLTSGEGVAPTTLSVGAGTLQGSDTVTVSGVFTWTGGLITGAATLFANGGMSISGAPVKDLTASRVLVVGGNTTWTGTGAIRLGSPASITQNGIWDCQSDAAIVSLVSPGTFTNSAGAIFRKSVGTGTSSVNVPFTNPGTVQVQSGTLSLNGGGSHSGTITGSPGTTVQFAGGTHALLAASTLSASSFAVTAGTVNVDGSFSVSTSTSVETGAFNLNPSATVASLGGSITLASGIATLSSGEALTPSTLNVSSGTLQGSDTVTVSGLFTWTGGLLTGAGTILANGGMSVSGAPVKDLTASRALVVAGSSTWTGTGAIRLGSSASIAQNGIWDCQSDAAIVTLGSAGGFANGAAATFKKSAGTGTTSVTVPFSNAGAVQALAGTLGFTGGFVQTAGSTTLQGGSISSSTVLDLQGGTLTGAGTATASASNAGIVAPGNGVGVLALAGSYAQVPAGSLQVELGGRIAGTEYDQLQVTGGGTATFAGSLSVSLVNGFTPVGGDSFTLATYASSAGIFTSSSLPPLAAGCWRTFYNPTALVLEVWTVTPEVQGVVVHPDKSTVAWSSLPPTSGPAPTYDLMRGTIRAFPVGSSPAETCVASATIATSASDPSIPVAGSGYYYLVRGVNVCGPGGYGLASNGSPRSTLACP